MQALDRIPRLRAQGAYSFSLQREWPAAAPRLSPASLQAAEERRSAAERSELPALYVGQRVQAAHQPGTIEAENVDGSFVVAFDDGQHAVNVPPSALKALEPAAGRREELPQWAADEAAALGPGARVRCNFWGMEKASQKYRHFPGTIRAVNAGGSYHVEFDNGDYAKTAPRSSIKLIEAAPGHKAPQSARRDIFAVPARDRAQVSAAARDAAAAAAAAAA